MADPRVALQFMRKHAALGALLGITVRSCTRSYIDASLDDFAKSGRLSPVFNPWEHLNYFTFGSQRRLLDKEGFTVMADYGRTKTARDACSQFGAAPANLVLNTLRVMKRAATSGPTTELFCGIRKMPLAAGPTASRNLT